jgi:hypothetical protein
MTYSVHVTVTAGEAQVTSQTEGSNAPPDGVYTINGSVGAAGESIGVSVNELPAAGDQTGVGALRTSASAFVAVTPLRC